MISGRVVFVALALTLIGGVWASPITYSVDAQSSYFLVEETYNPDHPADPLFIHLSALGLGAGQQIVIWGGGDMYYGNGGPELPVILAGVFTADTWLGPRDWMERLTAVGSGPPGGATGVMGKTTFYSNSLTDISQDFLIPGPLTPITVTIPQGANYLAIGLIDRYYQDNVDPGNDIFVSLSRVPEPGTYVLLLAGLAGLMALRRRKA